MARAILTEASRRARSAIRGSRGSLRAERLTCPAQTKSSSSIACRASATLLGVMFVCCTTARPQDPQEAQALRREAIRRLSEALLWSVLPLATQPVLTPLVSLSMTILVSVVAGGSGMLSSPVAQQQVVETTHPQPRMPQKRERAGGGQRWTPAFHIRPNGSKLPASNSDTGTVLTRVPDTESGSWTSQRRLLKSSLFLMSRHHLVQRTAWLLNVTGIARTEPGHPARQPCKMRRGDETRYRLVCTSTHLHSFCYSHSRAVEQSCGAFVRNQRGHRNIKPETQSLRAQAFLTPNRSLDNSISFPLFPQA